MFSSVYSVNQAVVILLSRYGEAIQECREIAGYDKQGEVAAASLKLASEYPELFQAFSQQWLSRLEADNTGEAIRKAQPLKLLALAYLLKLTSAAFYQRVGVAIAPVPLLETLGDASLERYRQAPAALSPTLQEAINQYGGRFPKLREDRWQRWLANTEFREEPETAEDWLAVFLDFEKKINPR